MTRYPELTRYPDPDKDRIWLVYTSDAADEEDSVKLVRSRDMTEINQMLY